MKLTKDDITALRQADEIVVHIAKTATNPNANKAEAIVSLVKKPSSDGVFKTMKCERKIGVDAYLPGWSRKAFACFLYVGGLQDGAIGALRQLIRPDDELVLIARENGNNYERDAGLHHEELTATIYRNGKTIIDKLVLTCSVCPDNTARMIQA